MHNDQIQWAEEHFVYDENYRRQFNTCAIYSKATISEILH